MGKIMVADQFINTDAITKISEKTLTFEVEVPSQETGLKRLFSSPEYNKEKYTCVVIKVSGGTRYQPPVEYDEDTYIVGSRPVGEYEAYDYYTIYNNKKMLIRAKEYFKGIRLDHAFTDMERKQINTLCEMGMEMNFGHWVNRSYLTNNMHYDPEIKTKQDFMEKYMGMPRTSYASNNRKAEDTEATDLPEEIPDSPTDAKDAEDGINLFSAVLDAVNKCKDTPNTHRASNNHTTEDAEGEEDSEGVPALLSVANALSEKCKDMPSMSRASDNHKTEDAEDEEDSEGDPALLSAMNTLLDSL